VASNGATEYDRAVEQPSFTEVFLESARHSWNNEGLSGKALVIMLVALSALLVAVAVGTLAWVIA